MNVFTRHSVENTFFVNISTSPRLYSLSSSLIIQLIMVNQRIFWWTCQSSKLVTIQYRNQQSGEVLTTKTKFGPYTDYWYLFTQDDLAWNFYSLEDFHLYSLGIVHVSGLMADKFFASWHEMMLFCQQKCESWTCIAFKV